MLRESYRIGVSDGGYWREVLNSDASEYGVTHGAGFTTFTHDRRDIASELTMSIAPDAPVNNVVLPPPSAEIREEV